MGALLPAFLYLCIFAFSSLVRADDDAPRIVIQSSDSRTDIPEGLKLECGERSVEAGAVVDCPVLIWRGYEFWAFSHDDDRDSVTLVGYPMISGARTYQWEQAGARNIGSMSVEGDGRYVLMIGWPVAEIGGNQIIGMSGDHKIGVLILELDTDAHYVSPSAVTFEATPHARVIATGECPACDMAGMHFEHLDLARGNFRKADLSDALLYEISLVDADPEGAIMAGADLMDADLTRANLKHVDLTGANLDGANLTDADLSNINLTEAGLENADLTGAVMTGAILTNTWFCNTTMADGTINNDGDGNG